MIKEILKIEYNGRINSDNAVASYHMTGNTFNVIKVLSAYFYRDWKRYEVLYCC